MLSGGIFRSICNLEQTDTDILNMGKMLAIMLLVLTYLGLNADDSFSSEDDEFTILSEIIANDNAERLVEKDILAFIDSESEKVQKESFIDWEKLNLLNWGSLAKWKDDVHRRDQMKEWERNRRDLSLRETVARVLDCVGVCRAYRGRGFANAQFRSEIREGDDLITSRDSYAWIYLMDGSLMRISPETSVTFNEINIGKKKTFFLLRVNTGQIIWQHRSRTGLKSTSSRETDALFLPISMFEANDISEEKEYDQDNLMDGFSRQSKVENQYIRLNLLIESNNKVLEERETIGFIVMANGTVISKNPNIEILSGLEGVSYMKSFTQKRLVENDSSQAEFFFRGYSNKSSEILEENTWYKAGERGRELVSLEVEESNNFKHGLFFISNIPTILIARELMLAIYSSKLFNKKITEDFLMDLNYRLWDEGTEIEKRIDFLKEYTRRQETRMLLVSERMRRLKKNIILTGAKYDLRFYRKAMNIYMSSGESREDTVGASEKLNSTKKSYWKYINVRR